MTGWLPSAGNGRWVKWRGSNLRANQQEAESKEIATVDLCKRHNITEQTFYRWRNKFGGMDVSDARRLRELESENDKLKRMAAEQLLVIDGLKELSRKK
jgi:putative transposase